MITDEDRKAAESLAHAICGCAYPEQRRRDVAALLEYREAAFKAGQEAERARGVEWLRESIAYHCKHDDGLSGFDGIAQGQSEALEAFLAGEHLPAIERHAHTDQGEEIDLIRDQQAEIERLKRDPIAFVSENNEVLRSENRTLRARAETAEAECLEQARLLGMSAERELALRARIQSLTVHNRGI
jgi:hypothetical protein